MVNLPQTAEYALRAVLHIASQTELVRVASMAEALGMPRNYLSKTLHQLAKAGVLESTRGPRGGFQLAVPADQLTLAAILKPFGVLDGGECLLGRAECLDSAPCAAHWRWKAISGSLQDFFGQTTVKDLRRGAPRPRAAGKSTAGPTTGKS